MLAYACDFGQQCPSHEPIVTLLLPVGYFTWLNKKIFGEVFKTARSDVESQQWIYPTCLQRQCLKDWSILEFIGSDIVLQALFVSAGLVSNSQHYKTDGAILLNYIILFPSVCCACVPVVWVVYITGLCFTLTELVGIYASRTWLLHVRPLDNATKEMKVPKAGLEETKTGVHTQILIASRQQLAVGVTFNPWMQTLSNQIFRPEQKRVAARHDQHGWDQENGFCAWGSPKGCPFQQKKQKNSWWSYRQNPTTRFSMSDSKRVQGIPLCVG